MNCCGCSTSPVTQMIWPLKRSAVCGSVSGGKITTVSYGETPITKFGDRGSVWAARPQAYDTKRSIATTYAARTMRWSGVILALFVVYHLLHLTAGVVSFQPGAFVHLSVYHNVVAAFSVWYVSLFYIVAMACLCLHLDHGIWSMFQTLGWNNARTTRFLQALSRGVALVVFGGFTSVPIAVLAGWVR